MEELWDFSVGIYTVCLSLNSHVLHFFHAKLLCYVAPLVSLTCAGACQFQCKLQNILCHKADDSYDKKIKGENIRALKGILQF